MHLDQELLDALVTDKRLNRKQAAQLQKEAAGQSLEMILVEQGLVDRGTLLDFKARLTAIPAVELDPRTVDLKAARMLPQSMSERFAAVGYELAGGKLKVALANPTDPFARYYLEMRTGREVELYAGYLGDVRAIQQQAYSSQEPKVLSGPSGRLGPRVHPAEAAPPNQDRRVAIDLSGETPTPPRARPHAEAESTPGRPRRLMSFRIADAEMTPQQMDEAVWGKQADPGAVTVDVHGPPAPEPPASPEPASAEAPTDTAEADAFDKTAAPPRPAISAPDALTEEALWGMPAKQAPEILTYSVEPAPARKPPVQPPQSSSAGTMSSDTIRLSPEEVDQLVAERLAETAESPPEGVVQEEKAPEAEGPAWDRLAAWGRAAREYDDLVHVVRSSLDAARHLTGASAVAFLLCDPNRHYISYEDALGARHDATRFAVPYDDSTLPGRAIVDNETISVEHLEVDERFDVAAELEIGLPVRGATCVPVGWGNQVVGAITAYSIHNRPPDARPLEVFASALGAAVTSWRTEQHRRDVTMECIEALLDTLDAARPGLRAHAVAVTRLTTTMGRYLELSPAELEELCFASLLLDLGRLGHPDPESHEHPQLGGSILQKVDLLQRLVTTVRYHHERWDGSGFPFGLRGEALPFLSRILAVAEAYVEDGLTDSPIDSPAVKQFLHRFGTHFDPSLKSVFVRALHPEEAE